MRREALRARSRRLALLPVFLALGCRAPASHPAKGPIADEVRRAISQGRGTFDHSAWNDLLGSAVRGGLVDYAYVQEHRAALDGYLDAIAKASLPSLSGPELKALLINSYNAYTVRAILDHPSVRSIKEIGGVWTRAKHVVGGHEVTLDEIEHNLLRPFFKDPRIHFAVNCASRSCAELPWWAYAGSSIDSQLEERARAFLGDDRHVKVEGGTLFLSRYFDWYGKDFTAPDWRPRADTVASFVGLYAKDDVRAFVTREAGSPRVAFLDYDWSLNDAGPMKVAPARTEGP